MNESQTTILEDEDVNELDWRIYEPNVRRLMTLVGQESESWPRLWLMDACDGHGPDLDILWIQVPESTYIKLWDPTVLGGAWEATHQPLLRMGTWLRYQQDVAHAQLVTERLGWTLTDEERALMDALEEYGQQAPARYMMAA